MTNETKLIISEGARDILGDIETVREKTHAVTTAEAELAAARADLKKTHADVKAVLADQGLSLPFVVSIGEKLLTIHGDQATVTDAMRVE